MKYCPTADSIRFLLQKKMNLKRDQSDVLYNKHGPKPPESSTLKVSASATMTKN